MERYCLACRLTDNLHIRRTGVPAAHSMHPNHSIAASEPSHGCPCLRPLSARGPLGHKRSSAVKWVTTPRLTRPRLGGKEAGGARPPQSYEWFAKACAGFSPSCLLACLPVRFALLAKHFLPLVVPPSLTPSLPPPLPSLAHLPTCPVERTRPLGQVPCPHATLHTVLPLQLVKSNHPISHLLTSPALCQ